MNWTDDSERRDVVDDVAGLMYRFVVGDPAGEAVIEKVLFCFGLFCERKTAKTQMMDFDFTITAYACACGVSMDFSDPSNVLKRSHLSLLLK